MRISIVGDTPAASGRNRLNDGLAQLKAGDLLQARIVEITVSGRAVFQFDGFRAMTEKFLGGQVGDVWQFEVAPAANEQNGQLTFRFPTAHVPQSTSVSRIPDAVTQGGLLLRLTTLLKTQTESAPNKRAYLSLPGKASLVPDMTTSAVASDKALFQPVQILSSWLQQMRNLRPWSGRKGRENNANPRKLQALTRKQMQPLLSGRIEVTDSNKGDRFGQDWEYFLSSGFQLGQRPVKMKMYRHIPGRGRQEVNALWTAVFLLNLDDCGPVRVDVKMGDDHIHVGFLVENENVRRHITETLPALSNALSVLTRQCYYRVDVAPDVIQDAFDKKDTAPETMQLDIRA